MTELILRFLLIVNAVGLVLMLTDKLCAIKNLRRIPEATLMTVALLGGSFGCFMGMYLFHHKTRHIRFRIGIPLILIVQTVLIFGLTK